MTESLYLSQEHLQTLPKMAPAIVPDGFRVLYGIIYDKECKAVGLMDNYSYQAGNYYPKVIPEYAMDNENLVAPLVFKTMTESEVEDDVEEDSTHTDKLIHLIIDSECKLFHDSFGNAMVAIHGDGRLIMKVRSKEFKTWLANIWWKKFRKGVGQTVIDTATITLEGMAIHEGDEIALHARVASLNGDWYYDLGDGRVVKISSQGWIVQDEPPILFYRYSHQKPQVEPERGGSFGEVFETLLTPETKQERLLLSLWLLAAFIPDIYHPILLVHGEQGSRKTTLFKMLRSIVDPSVLETLTVRKEITEFVQQASHHYFLPLDNLSEVRPDFSDLLCRVVTGEGFAKRELYTTDSDVIYSFQRVVGLNGINLVADKPDLLDRAIIIKLIPPDQYIDERVIFDKLHVHKAKIMGAIFDMLVLTKSELVNTSDTQQLSAYRMAGFAKQSLAIGRSLGLKDDQVIAALQFNRDMQHGHVVESSLLLQLIVGWMEDKPTWEGTAQELVEALKSTLGIDVVDIKAVPSAQVIKRKITEIIPTLRAQQITFYDRRTTKRLMGFINSRYSPPLETKAFSFEEIAEGLPFADNQNDINDNNDANQLTLS